jgi:hypothetical protein
MELRDCTFPPEDDRPGAISRMCSLEGRVGGKTVYLAATRQGRYKRESRTQNYRRRPTSGIPRRGRCRNDAGQAAPKKRWESRSTPPPSTD